MTIQLYLGPSPGRKAGTYALLLHARQAAHIRVGRLGRLKIVPGWYVYVGSALGPGGLAARLNHHRKKARRPRWHIDYLRRRAEITAVFCAPEPVRREHQWAEALKSAPGASMPLPGFGSSDCRCTGHLFFFPRKPALRALARQFRGQATKSPNSEPFVKPGRNGRSPLQSRA